MSRRALHTGGSGAMDGLFPAAFGWCRALAPCSRPRRIAAQMARSCDTGAMQVVKHLAEWTSDGMNVLSAKRNRIAPVVVCGRVLPALLPPSCDELFQPIEELPGTTAAKQELAMFRAIPVRYGEFWSGL